RRDTLPRARPPLRTGKVKDPFPVGPRTGCPRDRRQDAGATFQSWRGGFGYGCEPIGEAGGGAGRGEDGRNPGKSLAGEEAAGARLDFGDGAARGTRDRA